MTTISRGMRSAAIALLVAVGSLSAGVATASAAPADAPSSCRPANHVATVRQDDSSAGHTHYRVTLTAAPGYSPCALDGTPTDVVFTLNGSPNGATAAPSGQPSTPVTFGPGQPVHFDVQTPDEGFPVSTEGVDFTLPGVAGEQEATGYMAIHPGTQVGPVQPGA